VIAFMLLFTTIGLAINTSDIEVNATTPSVIDSTYDETSDQYIPIAVYGGYPLSQCVAFYNYGQSKIKIQYNWNPDNWDFFVDSNYDFLGMLVSLYKDTGNPLTDYKDEAYDYYYPTFNSISKTGTITLSTSSISDNDWNSGVVCLEMRYIVHRSNTVGITEWSDDTLYEVLEIGSTAFIASAKAALVSTMIAFVVTPGPTPDDLITIGVGAAYVGTKTLLKGFCDWLFDEGDASFKNTYTADDCMLLWTNYNPSLGGCHITRDPLLLHSIDSSDELVDEWDLLEASPAEKISTWTHEFHISNMRDFYYLLQGDSGSDDSSICSMNVANADGTWETRTKTGATNSKAAKIRIVDDYTLGAGGELNSIFQNIQPLYRVVNSKGERIDFTNAGPNSALDYDNFLYTPVLSPIFIIGVDGELANQASSDTQTFHYEYNYWDYNDAYSNTHICYDDFTEDISHETNIDLYSRSIVIEDENSKATVIVSDEDGNKFQIVLNKPKVTAVTTGGIDGNGNWYYQNPSGQTITDGDQDTSYYDNSVYYFDGDMTDNYLIQFRDFYTISQDIVDTWNNGGLSNALNEVKQSMAPPVYDITNANGLPEDMNINYVNSYSSRAAGGNLYNFPYDQLPITIKFPEFTPDIVGGIASGSFSTTSYQTLYIKEVNGDVEISFTSKCPVSSYNLNIPNRASSQGVFDGSHIFDDQDGVAFAYYNNPQYCQFDNLVYCNGYNQDDLTHILLSDYNNNEATIVFKIYAISESSIECENDEVTIWWDSTNNGDLDYSLFAGDLSPPYQELLNGIISSTIQKTTLSLSLSCLNGNLTDTNFDPYVKSTYCENNGVRHFSNGKTYNA